MNTAYSFVHSVSFSVAGRSTARARKVSYGRVHGQEEPLLCGPPIQKAPSPEHQCLLSMYVSDGTRGWSVFAMETSTSPKVDTQPMKDFLKSFQPIG